MNSAKSLEAYLNMIAGMVREPGPVAWHSRCSRYHRRGADCGLVPVRRHVNGHYREHLHHPPKHKPLRKKSVRKS
jgi:hypothetical protein